MSENLFKDASRKKLRFSSVRGELSVEQLWDLPLSSNDGFNLDVIAQQIARAAREADQQSFVDQTKITTYQKRVNFTLEVIKDVIKTKLEEEAERKKQRERREEKEKLLRVLADKKEGQLSDLSIADLEKRIKDLDND